ncbi:MAG: hypothetical protein H0T73_03795, partial [Ardenticatenales bacterium]|nr:hypothetical protein [Ardenticatenales bacterium]
AALARLYIRDGWYHRATEELRSEVADEADRVDLLAGLAEAYWRAGDRQEAINVCNEVLMELPYCLKCNLLIGELYAQQGDLASADRYLRIAQELDPENEVAQELFGPSSYLRPNPIIIPSIDEVRQDTNYITGMREEPLPEWLADLSLFTTPELENEYVDWDAIIAYETHWRTILAKATREVIDQHKPQWEIELRRATYLALKQRGEAVQPSKSAERSQRERALSTEPTGARGVPIEIFDWRWVMRMAMLDEMDQADWRVQLRAATQNAMTPSDWRAMLRARTRLALGEEVGWREFLRLSTQHALVASPQWRSTLRAVTARSLQGEEAWPPALRAATERALRESVTWRAELRQTTSQALEGSAWQRTLYLATKNELDVQPAWVKALRQASSEAVEPQSTPWVARLRAESETIVAATAAEPESGLVGQLAEGVRGVAHRVQEVADTIKHKATDALGSLVHALSPGAKPPEQSPWMVQLRAATEIALADSPTVIDAQKTPGLPARLVESAEDALQRAQEAGKQITGKARGALTSFLRKPPSEEEAAPEPLSLEEAAEFWSDVTDEVPPVEPLAPETLIQEVPLEIEVPPSPEVAKMSSQTGELELPPVETLDDWIEGADEFWNDVVVDLATAPRPAISIEEEPTTTLPATEPETEVLPSVESAQPSEAELASGETPDWLAEMADEFWSDVSIDLGGGTPAPTPPQSEPIAMEEPLVVEEPEAASVEEPAPPVETEVSAPVLVEEPLEMGLLELPAEEELAGLMDSANDFWSDVSLDLTAPPVTEPEPALPEVIEPPVEAPQPSVEAAEPLGTAMLELLPEEEMAGLMDSANDYWSDVSLDFSAEPIPEPELGAAELAARHKAQTVSDQLEEVPAPAEAEALEPEEIADPLGVVPVELPPEEELADLMDAADDFWSDVSLDATPTTEPKGVRDAVLPPHLEAARASSPLQRAERLWAQGERTEALTLYHDLFHDRSVEDQSLSVALTEHIAAGDAPADAYQLLGDLYRRMGRMQEAVVQYREAIKRKR